MLKLRTFAVILAALPVAAQAATIDVSASSFVNNVQAFAIPSVGDFDSQSASVASPQTLVGVFSDASASGDMGSGDALSFASGNSVTGELKARTSKSVELAPGIVSGPEGGGLATATIKETLSLSGTGFLTISMLFDVTWNTLSAWQAEAAVQIGAITAFDSVVFGHNTHGAAGSVSNHLVTAIIGVTNAVAFDVDLTWSIFVQELGGSGDGSIDASNTGTIWFETSAGLNATPTDENFLSAPAYLDDIAGPQVVPLPASALLLLAGLSVLFGLKRRRVT